ncbi:hypothetical protein ERX46_10915 [Brumimicrobium glaciale]|uniref:Uncharacterized protein n=1 Tax=Brumimicrobium glaciale TaxID=200475 RepID=A0A4Q4KM44_9FLAO|nr:hypothetical protein [Brumimicrobium glaciale]RYM33444.1 hypothetical protein ERX46_10915 [Brumimicrobium glaciale]
MRKLKFIIAIACIAFAGTAEAQSFKEKMQAKLDKANAKLEKAAEGKSKYESYDFEDPSGISGTYFVNVPVIPRENTIGFEFIKEKDGEIVNNLAVIMGGEGYGDRPNSMKCILKEKYKTKFDVIYFEMVDKSIKALANNSDDFVYMEINPNVYTLTQNGKVLTVLAKDSSLFSDFDVETAQVLYDQNMSKINSAEAEKETAIWMKNELYAKNVDKIIFATEDWHLMKRGYGNKPPMVNGKGFTTVLDMAGNMNYMAFFKVPPATKYPGQEVNYVYEMGGKSTNRVECRSRSAAWGGMVKRLETSDFDYRQHSPRSLRTYNQYHSQYVQDYAFIQLLHMNKDNFKVGEKYNLTVKMYTNRDGENGELIAEGVVSLLYSEQAELAFNGDPDKPEKVAIWTQFEEFLDE